MIAFWLLLGGVSAYSVLYMVYQIKLRRGLAAFGALLLAALPAALALLLYLNA